MKSKQILPKKFSHSGFLQILDLFHIKNSVSIGVNPMFVSLFWINSLKDGTSNTIDNSIKLHYHLGSGSSSLILENNERSMKLIFVTCAKNILRLNCIWYHLSDISFLAQTIF